jgi:outer membrane protein OmpA-like peptidoglycan-associated protein
MVVTAGMPLKQVRLELTREDGKSFAAASGALRQQQQAVLAIGDGQGGRYKWTGKLIAVLPDGNRHTQELTFETAVQGDLRIGYTRERLDLDAHVLEFTLSRPAGSATLRVFADDGSEIGEGSATFSGEAAGTWLRLPWSESKKGNVMRLELRAVSKEGLAATAKLLPWSVRVPHEEVVFETGKWEIRPSEEQKLDASYKKIVDALDVARKADPTLQVKLFIAGHTDTVGTSADNRVLSRERARAIGAWFREHGLPLPVLVAGFGEDAPKVKTPDNTDSAANRRADYIVGVEEPVVARGVRAPFTALK